MNTPGISHVILSVSDLEQSKKFYGDLLGFEIKTLPSDADTFFFMCGSASIWFVAHEQIPPGDRFSEFRIGLDHLAFSAPDEAALNALADKLIAAGVDTKGVETFHRRWRYCAFRDPDNIQLEYWLDQPIGGE
jgi:glyoxylase I family protein